MRGSLGLNFIAKRLTLFARAVHPEFIEGVARAKEKSVCVRVGLWQKNVKLESVLICVNPCPINLLK